MGLGKRLHLWRRKRRQMKRRRDLVKRTEANLRAAKAKRVSDYVPILPPPPPPPAPGRGDRRG